MLAPAFSREIQEAAVPAEVLVLYDGASSQLQALAEAVAQGAQEETAVRVVKKDVAQATRADLLSADAIILGSPNWSGVTGTLKRWLDEQGDLWEDGSLGGKVGAAFATGRGRHSGLEFTLLSLIHWLLASGMVVAGLPWSPAMESSGSYYGATVAGAVTPQDLEQGRALGRRVAELAIRLGTST